MSNYTIKLKTLIELYGYDEIEKWFSDYEISDYLTNTQMEILKNINWSKEKLAKKCINHFYMSEIGFETPQLFKLNLKDSLDQIMEYQLPVLYSKAIEFDPLVDVDYTEKYTRDIINDSSSEGSSKSNSSSSGSGLSVNSNTPEGQISKEKILHGNYASSTGASETEANNTDKTDTTSSASGITKESYSRNVMGNMGTITSSQLLIKDYRKIIIAVDKDIIEELEPLFIGIY